MNEVVVSATVYDQTTPSRVILPLILSAASQTASGTAIAPKTSSSVVSVTASPPANKLESKVTTSPLSVAVPSNADGKSESPSNVSTIFTFSSKSPDTVAMVPVNVSIYSPLAPSLNATTKSPKSPVQVSLTHSESSKISQSTGLGPE